MSQVPSKSKVYGLIPARYASSRFPGKMLHTISGKSLIQWTYENALALPCFDQVMVGTDHQEIFDHVLSFGGNVVMTDPKHPTGTDRIIEMANQHFPEKDEETIFINLQGDEPFTSLNTCQGLIEALRENQGYFIATSAYPIFDEKKINDPSIVKCLMNQKNEALYFSRSPIPFVQKKTSEKKLLHYGHLGIYAFKWKHLQSYKKLPSTPYYEAEDLEQLKVLEHGLKIKIILVQNEEGLGVNTPDDVSKVESYIWEQNLSS